MEFKTKFNVGDKVLVIERIVRNDLYYRVHGGFLISKDEIREIRFGDVIRYIMLNSTKSISEENVFSREDINGCVNKLTTLIENKVIEESDLE